MKNEINVQINFYSLQKYDLSNLASLNQIISFLKLFYFQHHLLFNCNSFAS